MNIGSCTACGCVDAASVKLCKDCGNEMGALRGFWPMGKPRKNHVSKEDAQRKKAILRAQARSKQNAKRVK